jgi:hypothetical protein
MPLIATHYRAVSTPLYAFDADLPAIPFPRTEDRVYDAVWVTTRAGILTVSSGVFRAFARGRSITTFRNACDWADPRDGGDCFAKLTSSPAGDRIWTADPLPPADYEATARFLAMARDGLPDPPEGYTGWFRLVRTDAPPEPSGGWRRVA